MTEMEIENELLNIKKSMEFEGFNIGDELMEQGRKIIKGELRAVDIVAKYVKEAKEWSLQNQ